MADLEGLEEDLWAVLATVAGQVVVPMENQDFVGQPQAEVTFEDLVVVVLVVTVLPGEQIICGACACHSPELDRSMVVISSLNYLSKMGCFYS